MILAREYRSNTGKRYYELTESVSRRRKTWQPPFNLPCNQVEDALFNAGALFEKEVAEQNKAKQIMVSNKAEIDASTTLEEYTSQVFLPRKAIRVAERTRYTMQSYLSLRIYPRLGNRPIGSITVSDLTDFFLGCQSEGLSISSVRKYYSLLNCIFRMAYQTEVIKQNPMLKVERPTPRKDEILKQGVDAYNEMEIAKILDCLKNEPLKWQVFIGLLIDTGIRNGECCALQWSDINWKESTIRIKASLSYTPDKGVYLSTPKNRRERIVSVSDNVMLLLLELFIDNASSVDSKYVFTQRKSKDPMHPHSPNKYLQKFGKQYGIEHLYPHKLRHSFASIAITNGADIASVSEVLGHQDKAITLRAYTSANEESMKKVSNICHQAVEKASEKISSVL